VNILHDLGVDCRTIVVCLFSEGFSVLGSAVGDGDLEVLGSVGLSEEGRGEEEKEEDG
jgi:hypothetical protein